MHVDDAYDHLVEFLSGLPRPGSPAYVQHRRSSHECDLWLPFVIPNYWRTHDPQRSDINQVPSDGLGAFYDAAWDLCRIGVLRPGKFAPKGQSMAHQLGDGYTVTGAGWDWLKDATRQSFPHSSRLAEILQSLGSSFGDGYRQRAAEAVRSYRTHNYLAACVMAGAAAESILIAVAVAKRGGNEAEVLANYKSQGGRSRVMKQLLGSVDAGIATQFQHASQILHYWRDDAGHGTATTISEIEAHQALNQLLRLAQFTGDHWKKLTS